MASALANVVVGKFGGMVLDQITKEASLVLNFRKDSEWLSKKLKNIGNYLKNADVQSAHNESVKSWLLDVADIAMDAEDILEECSVESMYSNSSSQSSCGCPFKYSQLVFRYKMGRRIKDVKDRMRSIMEDAAELKLAADLTRPDQPSTSTSQNVRWKRSSMVESDARPVAIHSKVEDIISLLDDPAAPVIAVVGMGGVGKTFLLQNVFNRIKNRFDNYIWLAISQTYSLQRLQADLASQIKLEDVVNASEEQAAEFNHKREILQYVVNGKVGEVRAAELIHELLESTRSLIVLDDVWRATGEDDLISTLGLPTGNNSQCKTVVSTRMREVCRNMNARVYEMKALSEEDSWKLFCAFAFPECEQNLPPQHIEEIAHLIEKECCGLPLALKTVAASLADKTLFKDWESKLRQLKEVTNYWKDDPIMPILKLSYDSLPASLKPCFAYLSFFPEDEEIDPQYLINLWIAEGFIHSLEDQVKIGWSYIYHLHSLCLIEMVEKDYDQQTKRCKIHDLLLDLAISLSKESQCAFSVGEAFTEIPAIQRSSCCRKILLAKKGIVDGVIANSSANSASRLRTLSMSGNDGIQNIPANLFTGVKVLRVLDFSFTGISTMPRCFGNLKLLRVLNLCRTEIDEVPECVRSLKRLRLLDMSNCRRLKELLVWIGELNCLECLDINGCDDRIRMPKGISMLASLQTLRSDGIYFSERNELLKLEDVVKMINLRQVSTKVDEVGDLKRIEEGILAPLVNMRNMRISNYSGEFDLLSLWEKMLAMKDLEILYLRSFAVPVWVCGFSNLVQLTLWGCDCEEYPSLEMMPNLIRLELWRNKICKVLPKGFGKPRGFPQLRCLEIYKFDKLEELAELEDGAMPRLEMLRVTGCRRVKKAPGGLEQLKSLKECHFFGTGGNGLTEELLEGGEYRNKIEANNPNVTFRLSYDEE